MTTIEQIGRILEQLQTVNKVQAIKEARDQFHIPLITAKSFVEMLQIVTGGTICRHCRHSLTPEDVEKGREIRFNG